jgi:excisionase family DNA binding protein
MAIVVTMDSLGGYLTPAQVARALGLTTSAVYKVIARTRVPVVKVGRQYYLRLSDFRAVRGE